MIKIDELKPGDMIITHDNMHVRVIVCIISYDKNSYVGCWFNLFKNEFYEFTEFDSKYETYWDYL